MSIDRSLSSVFFASLRLDFKFPAYNQLRISSTDRNDYPRGTLLSNTHTSTSHLELERRRHPRSSDAVHLYLLAIRFGSLPDYADMKWR